MATKEELTKEIAELATELEIVVDLSEMKHDELKDLLKDLKAKKADAETVTQADAETSEGWTVAEGRSITSRVGMLSNGDKVSPNMLKGGQESFDRLVKAKILVKA